MVQSTAMQKQISNSTSVDAEDGIDGISEDVQKPPAPRVANSIWLALLVVGHAMSTSGLLVVNKWALQRFPFVAMLTTMQFLPSALFVGVIGWLRLVDVDRLELRKLLTFVPAAGMFYVTMTAGNNVVKFTNVDTFIVLRSVIPIPCAILEMVALSEPLPPPLAWLGLAILASGAVLYAIANQGLAVESFAWMLLFITMMPVDAVLIKHVIVTSGLNAWGLVLYQNLIAGTLGLFCTSITEWYASELAHTNAVETLMKMEIEVWLPVSLSILLGIALSFFQMLVRRSISSTAFLVLGVANKLLAMLLSLLTVEGANRSIASISAVILSVGGAMCFQQNVKGHGISQAAPPHQIGVGSRGVRYSYGAMMVGMLWSIHLMLR